MNDTPSDSPATPSWKPLDATQRRVLGVLIEKAKTTPAGYPMTVNAIVTGSNQKNNRAPLMNLESFDVEKALGELVALGAASEIDWMGRVAKYKHRAYEWLGVSKLEAALMAELLLRGDQALGELRSRADRMEPIADLAALKPVVDALVQRGLLVALTPPGRGQVVTHRLYMPREFAELEARYAGREPGEPVSRGDEMPARSPSPPAPAGATGVPGALALLFAEIEKLRAEVQNLEQRVRELESERRNPSG
jgi:uncharacterized protein YceH (UPF0502 family)